MTEFEAFPKIKRGFDFSQMIITEKIDGTNGQVLIEEGKITLIGSRKRIITPEDDNYGFAAFIEENRKEIEATLPDGRYFGEWWGEGIQKNPYRVSGKRFSLFYPHYWPAERPRPSCFDVVPILYAGQGEFNKYEEILSELYHKGSVAAPGSQYTEGVVIYFPKFKSMCKITHDGNVHKYEMRGGLVSELDS